MNSLFMGKYRPAIILTLALTVFLVSSKLPGKSWEVSTFAGGGNEWGGYQKGTGTEARFNRPGGVAVDSSGNVYVADSSNKRIRKITSTGTVTTIAGDGTTAQFNYPTDVAVDSSGNLYVADWFNHRIRKITSTGVVSTIAGKGAASHQEGVGSGGYHDATGEEAEFSFPSGVAVDSDNNVYVADTRNSRIRKITPAGVVTTIAGSSQGYKDTTGTEAQFAAPAGVAVDSDNNLYVAEYYNNRIRIISSAGVVSTLAGSSQGYKEGPGTKAEFHNPLGVAVDSSGNLYVADWGNRRIRRITPDRVVTTIAGSGTAGHIDATGTAAQFDFPTGVAVDSSGNVYVTDKNNHRIRKIEYK